MIRRVIDQLLAFCEEGTTGVPNRQVKWQFIPIGPTRQTSHAQTSLSGAVYGARMDERRWMGYCGLGGLSA